MKRLSDIGRLEKIQLLQAIKNGDVETSQLTGNVFILEKRSDFFLLSLMNASAIKNKTPLINGIMINPGLKDFAKEFDGIMSKATKIRKEHEKSVNQ